MRTSTKNSIKAVAVVALLLLLAAPFQPAYVAVAARGAVKAAQVSFFALNAAAVAFSASFQESIGYTSGSRKSSAAVTVSPVPTAGNGPLVNNGNFEYGKAPWLFYTDGIGTFTLEKGLDNGMSAKILTSTVGKDVELYQQGILVEPDTTYKLSFSAKSSSGRDVSVSIGKRSDPSETYGLGGRVFDLTPDWQTFSVEFTSADLSAADPDARLAFWLSPYAEIGDQFWFDNVSLEKISGASGSSTSAAPAHFGLTDVSLNGSPVSADEAVFADILGNGTEDIVAAVPTPASSAGTSTVSSDDIVWFAPSENQNAPIAQPAEHVIGSGEVFGSILSLDMNGDGAIDLVADVDHSMWWFENPKAGIASGTPWKKHYIGTGAAGPVFAADIDGDGLEDIVAGPYVYFQNDPLHFEQKRINALAGAGALFDSGAGYGAADLIGTESGNYVPAWFENPRGYGGNPRTDPWWVHELGGTFPACYTVPCADRFGGYASYDIDGDGKSDIIVGESGQGASQPLDGLVWFKAPADRRNGTWTENSIDSSFSLAEHILVSDMNGDGVSDIIASEGDGLSGRETAIFYDDGKGNFLFHDFSLGDGLIFDVLHLKVPAEASGSASTANLLGVSESPRSLFIAGRIQ